MTRNEIIKKLGQILIVSDMIPANQLCWSVVDLMFRLEDTGLSEYGLGFVRRRVYQNQSRIQK